MTEPFQEEQSFSRSADESRRRLCSPLPAPPITLLFCSAARIASAPPRPRAGSRGGSWVRSNTKAQWTHAGWMDQSIDREADPRNWASLSQGFPAPGGLTTRFRFLKFLFRALFFKVVIQLPAVCSPDRVRAPPPDLSPFRSSQFTFLAARVLPTTAGSRPGRPLRDPGSEDRESTGVSPRVKGSVTRMTRVLVFKLKVSSSAVDTLAPDAFGCENFSGGLLGPSLDMFLPGNLSVKLSTGKAKGLALHAAPILLDPL